MIWPASRVFVEVIDVIEWRVTTVPKVGTPPYVLEAAAPRVGDDAVRSRLYAGKPGESSTTRDSVSVRKGPAMDRSDNVRGAENQQERLWNPENPQRPYADHLDVNATR